MGHRIVPRAQDRLAPGRPVAQLAAVASVDGLLTQNGIRYWLFGGWAVDFYAGAITRAHDDVDIAVSLGDHHRIAALLAREGWVHAPEPDEEGGTGYEREGVRLELTFIEQVPWPADASGADRRELDGVAANLVSLAALKRGKAAPRDDAADAAKDQADRDARAPGRDMTGPPGRAALDAVSRARGASPVSLLLVEAGSEINSFSRTLKRRSPE